VVLVGYGQKFYLLKEDGSGGLDGVATEVFRGTVPTEKALDEFIRRVKALPAQQRLAVRR
jgi:hypothetical protein